jgi:hypothetical protein
VQRVGLLLLAGVILAGGCVGRSEEIPAKAAGASGDGGASLGPGAGGPNLNNAGRGGTTGDTGGHPEMNRSSGGAVARGGTSGRGSSGTSALAGEGGAAGTDTLERGGSSAGGAPDGVRHPACAVALLAKLPAVPKVNQDTTGRPHFDRWRDLGCEELGDTLLCSEAGGQGGATSACSGLCLLGRPTADDGVCTYPDIDRSCDGEGEVVGYADGQCWVCAPPDVHARACCEGLPGFDCRAWPFPANGKPGMVCARHEDCEPGLLCGPGGTYSAGYGICQCPGVDLEPAALCRL